MGAVSLRPLGGWGWGLEPGGMGWTFGRTFGCLFIRTFVLTFVGTFENKMENFVLQ